MSNANGGPDPRGATKGAAPPGATNGAAPPDPLRDGPLAGARRRILRHLEGHGPDRPGHLPRSWPVTRLHVSALLEPLFRAGLVRRDRDPRGRMVVGLTTEGHRRAYDGRPGRPEDGPTAGDASRARGRRAARGPGPAAVDFRGHRR